MLNQEKVRDMTQMAIYEKGDGEQDLYVTSYRKMDYVALQLVKSFILGTIAAAIILVFYFLMHLDFIDKLTTLESIKSLVMGIGIFYIIFILAYMVLTFFWARRVYKSSLSRSEAYRQGLSRVIRSYQTPEEAEAEATKNTQKTGFLKWRR